MEERMSGGLRVIDDIEVLEDPPCKLRDPTKH
jgi:hypothetical protein